MLPEWETPPNGPPSYLKRQIKMGLERGENTNPDAEE